MVRVGRLRKNPAAFGPTWKGMSMDNDHPQADAHVCVVLSIAALAVTFAHRRKNTLGNEEVMKTFRQVSVHLRSLRASSESRKQSKYHSAAM